MDCASDASTLPSMGLGSKKTASALLRRSAKFVTDPVGLERTIRLLQAILQLGSHYSFAFSVIQSVIDSTALTSQAADTTRSAIQSLHENCALSRRLFRLYRFVGSLHGIHGLRPVPAPSALEPPVRTHAVAGAGAGAGAGASWSAMESCLDVAGEGFNTVYLLLEAVTTVDYLQTRGSRFLTVELERVLSLESSRFWLFSLICGALSGLLRVLSILLPLLTPDQPQEHEDAKDRRNSASSLEVPASRDPPRQKPPSRRRNIWPELQVAGRRCLANALDIAQPGVTMGWVAADRGVIGVVMLVTTILTAMDVWDRCGEEEQQQEERPRIPEAHAKEE